MCCLISEFCLHLKTESLALTDPADSLSPLAYVIVL